MENRMWWQTHDWVTYAKPSRRSTDPDVSTFSWRFLKQNYTKYISSVVSKILKKKKWLSNLWSAFVTSLKVSFLWWKLTIFVANFFLDFSYKVDLLASGANLFWPGIFTMFLSSRLTITWRRKKYCCNKFDVKPQFDWTTEKSVSFVQLHHDYMEFELTISL